MLSLWFDDVFSEMEAIWRGMDELSAAVDPRRGLDGRHGLLWTGQGPVVRMHDDGEAWLVSMDVPGLTAEDVEVTVQEDRLTLQGHRKLDPPEGWKAHRQERGSWEFSRTFALPGAVDAEGASATVKDGVLTLTLPRLPEVRPRAIAVRSA